MTELEMMEAIVEKDEKIVEALVLATDVIGQLKDRIIKLEETVYGSNK